jgi:hypothetical protein
MNSAGKVPEKDWLKGSGLGWNGPWGTTYAPNLRLILNGLDQEQWIKKAKTLKTRPPMPWFNLNAMTEEDLMAIYQFVKSLGPAGKPAPAYLPPEKKPTPPYGTFVFPPSNERTKGG